MVAVARRIGPGHPGRRWPGGPGKLSCPLPECRHGCDCCGRNRSIGTRNDDCWGSGPRCSVGGGLRAVLNLRQSRRGSSQCKFRGRETRRRRMPLEWLLGGCAGERLSANRAPVVMHASAAWHTEVHATARDLTKRCACGASDRRGVAATTQSANAP